MIEMIANILKWAPVVLLSIIVHEVAHGWAAYKLGDDTAARMGRLTLNPIPHIDPIGTIFLPIMLLVFSGGTTSFGWAKPVPFNPYRFYRHVNMRKGTMLVALAGPVSNFIMAFIGSFVMVAFYKYTNLETAIVMAQAFVYINIFLALFNLIPVPPLDGSKILMGIMPAKYDRYFLLMERYSFLIFILIIILQRNSFSFLSYPANFLYAVLTYLPRLLMGVH